jgi:hypothetical protein
MRYLFLLGSAALLLAAAGCGGQPKLAPVSGRVFYRGVPLPGGTIVYTPDEERGGRGPLAMGEVGTDGRFTLSTGRHKGAVPGWHRITVAPAGRGGGPALPLRYRDPEQSGWRLEVKPDRANTHELNLE